MATTYTVTALWDGEAKVWVATSEDIKGLIIEADTPEMLMPRVTRAARALLSHRNADGGKIVMVLSGEITDQIGHLEAA